MPQRGYLSGRLEGRPEKAGSGSAEPGRGCSMREVVMLGSWSWQWERISGAVSRAMKETALTGLGGQWGMEAGEQGISNGLCRMGWRGENDRKGRRPFSTDVN